MIAVNSPIIAKNAQKYVLDCIKSGWISSAGLYIEKFEKKFAEFLGVKFAVTTTNGTSALHLAVASLGIGPGDEVIIPDLTIISCALAVLYTGAKPVFIDVEKMTGNIDPARIEEKISKKTKAIMVVHLYGHPADMDPILHLARKHNLKVIEDAAEAHGAEYKGKKVGGLGDIGCFSFYANKVVTTGEGGMVVTNSEEIYEKAKLLKDLAHSPKRRFMHEEIGFNYRMTNLQAALGVAQLEEVENYIKKKRSMAELYIEGLKNLPNIELLYEAGYAKSVYWMFPLLVSKKNKITRDEFREKLKDLGVDTRDFFYPLHSQPVFDNLKFSNREEFPISTDLSNRGFYIPSGLALTKNEINKVINAVKKVANE